jgi:hypothetical protein
MSVGSLIKLPLFSLLSTYLTQTRPVPESYLAKNVSRQGDGGI